MQTDKPAQPVFSALEELRRLWAEGLDSGPLVDGEEAFARIRLRLDTAVRTPLARN